MRRLTRYLTDRMLIRSERLSILGAIVAIRNVLQDHADRIDGLLNISDTACQAHVSLLDVVKIQGMQITALNGAVTDLRAYITRLEMERAALASGVN